MAVDFETVGRTGWDLTDFDQKVPVADMVTEQSLRVLVGHKSTDGCLTVNANLKNASASAIAALMFLSCIIMWVGVPLGWLYVGSMIKGATDSIGIALGVMFVGVIVSIVSMVKLLGMLNNLYGEVYKNEAGEIPEKSPLEPVLVMSAGVALTVFGVWFIFFAGAGGSSLRLSF